MPSSTVASPRRKLLRKALDAPASATPRTTTQVRPEGIVRAIVAVTGVVDNVNDLIVPGAFTASLAVRRPKVVDDHEWGRKAGRVLHVEEWLPGDSRLPATTKDGKPWPAAAGALVATMQYNLASTAGRESYEWVRFYAETNEAEFSIGYRVPDGKARKRRDGVRIILMLDLFEFSHVLFGAASETMALEVKGMHAESAGQLNRPALTDVERADDDDDTPPAADSPSAAWDDEAGKAVTVGKRRASMECKSAAAVVTAVQAGNPDNLRKWFNAGADGAIPWGSDGDFDACVAVASKHMGVEDAKGFCNLRHHDVLGIYPATHAAMEGKSAGDPVPVEVKSMSQMKGSYEERSSLLRKAAEDLLNADTPAPGDSRRFWVSLVSTYDNEVVLTAYRGDGETSYLVPYVYDAEGGTVELGEFAEVELSLTAAPVTGDEDLTAEVPEVAEVVAEPLFDSLARVSYAATMETKLGERLRDRITEMAAGLAGKSADLSLNEDTPPAGDGGTEMADDDLVDGTTFTRDNLPSGDWSLYRKTDPIEAVKVDGRFTVQTLHGVVACDDGWLALDSEGWPYPIASDEFANVYTADLPNSGPSTPDDVDPSADPADPTEADPSADDTDDTDDTDEINPGPVPVDDPAEAAQVADEGDVPETVGDDPAEPAEDADDDTVTINPDDHFATMDDLNETAEKADRKLAADDDESAAAVSVGSARR